MRKRSTGINDANAEVDPFARMKARERAHGGGAGEGRVGDGGSDALFHEAMNPDAPASDEDMERHRGRMRAAGMDEAMIVRLYPLSSE